MSAESLKGCSLSSMDKCYGSLPTNGSTPNNLIEVRTLLMSWKLGYNIKWYVVCTDVYFSPYRKSEKLLTLKLVKRFAKICTEDLALGSFSIKQQTIANCFQDLSLIYTPIAKKLDTQENLITVLVM